MKRPAPVAVVDHLPGHTAVNADIFPCNKTGFVRTEKQWIFTDPLRPELPVAPPAAYRKMKQLLQKAGLPNIRLHDLRHTFATHALTSGVDAKTLSGILGHTNASFTVNINYRHTNEILIAKAA